MCIIIGRDKEISELKRRMGSGRPEFVVVYGRRRVGKTFLINEVLHDNMAFHHTGLAPRGGRPAKMKDQLQNFYFSLVRHGDEDATQPTTWLEAFFMLEQYLKRINNGSRQVVFLDELQWMDTKRSGFLTALEAFWNGWGNTQHNLFLVVCGSATSYILDNFIHEKGGMYGRVTDSIKLSPFTLKECEEFYSSRNIKMSHYNIAQAYMVMGGIPYYMDFFNPSYSLPQNIDALFFNKKAKLKGEFEHLFGSVFDHAEDCMAVIRTLGKRHYGYTRDEIARQTGINANGDFTKVLTALEESDFIEKYVPFGYSKREVHYKLTDPFCWFWLHFMDDKVEHETDYWENHLNESEIASWRGIAFEEICFSHIRQIKNALEIGGVSTRESAMIVHGENGKPTTQIDLLIDRRDDIVNVCEIKYVRSQLNLSPAYISTLRQRAEIVEQTFKGKTAHLTLIHTLGKSYRPEEFNSVICLDQLFA